MAVFKRDMKQLPAWFDDYNEYHPYKGLKIRCPRECRRPESSLKDVRFNGGSPSCLRI